METDKGEKTGMMYDLPLFMIAELSSGPYGPEITQKIAQIEKYYETYYNGAEFKVESSDDDNSEPSVIRSKKIKRLIDKQAEFMVGNTPTIKVSCIDKPEDCQNQDNLQKYLNKVLKQNNFAAKIIRGARDCFIGGRVFLKVNVLPEKITLMFIPADNFIYETEPDDVDTLSRVVLFYCVRETEDKGEQRWWRQRYRMENGKCLIAEDLYDGYGNKIDGYSTSERDTGLDRIPGVVIINEGLSGSVDGESDVDMISGEDETYNQMRSENNDNLLRNMNPMNYIIGASPKTFDRLKTGRGVWNDIAPDPVLKGTLPTVGKVDSSFSYTSSYESTLKNVTAEMFDNLGIPDIRESAISGLVTSGKGLKALYWPLISRCNGKWATWKPALETMARIIIDAAEVFPTLKQKYGTFSAEDYAVVIEENYALPEDEEEERKLDLAEVGIGRSVKSYLMKWGGANRDGLSAEKAEEEIKQMAMEKRMLSDYYPGELDGIEDEE